MLKAAPYHWTHIKNGARNMWKFLAGDHAAAQVYLEIFPKYVSLQVSHI